MGGAVAARMGAGLPARFALLCVAKLLVPVSTFAAGLIAEYSVTALFVDAAALWAATTFTVLAVLGRRIAPQSAACAR